MSAIEHLVTLAETASLKCSNCGELNAAAQEHEIYDEGDWQDRVGSEIVWLKSHKEEAIAAIPDLANDWPTAAQVIRALLEGS